MRTEWKKRDAARAASQSQQPRTAPNSRPPAQSYPPPQHHQSAYARAPPQPAQASFAPAPPVSYAAMVAKVTGPLSVMGFRR